MAALTADSLLSAESYEGRLFQLPQAASTTIFAGALVVKNSSGYAQPATAAQGNIAVGVAQEYSVNSGSNGDKKILVKRGVFILKPESGDAPTIASVGKACFAADDQTVGMTPGVRSIAGIVRGLDENGNVLVEVGYTDVESRNTVVSLSGIDLDDEALVRTHYIAAPVAGRIKKIYCATEFASTAGADAVATFAINGTSITGGVVTVPVSSAVGTVVSATPTAANAVAAGDTIRVVIAGSQTGDTIGNFSLVIEH